MHTTLLNITFPPAKSSSSLRRPSLSLVELAYLISNVELLHVVSLLHDLANKFMAADEVGRALQVSAVEMQVATAEGCGRDFEDCIGGLLDVGVGAVFDGDLELCVLDQLLYHETTWRSPCESIKSCSYLVIALQNNSSHGLRRHDGGFVVLLGWWCWGLWVKQVFSLAKIVGSFDRSE
jgi:hypothetical protein